VRRFEALLIAGLLLRIVFSVRAARFVRLVESTAGMPFRKRERHACGARERLRRCIGFIETRREGALAGWDEETKKRPRSLGALA
jgi:hypothetical protein